MCQKKDLNNPFDLENNSKKHICQICGKLVKNFKDHLRNIHKIQSHDYYLKFYKEEIINKTNSLQCRICGRIFDTKFKLSQHIRRNHHIKIKEYYDNYLKNDGDGACVVCGNKTNFNGSNRGYNICCSVKCAAQNEERSIKIESFWQQKSGVTNAFEDPNIKNKIKRYFKDEYNVDNVSQIDYVKEKIKYTWKNKTPEELKLIVEKRAKTLNRIYDCDNISKSNYFKEKIKYINDNKTPEEKLRTSSKIKEMWKNKTDEEKLRTSSKIKEMWKNKTDEELKLINDKKIVSYFKRYGVSHPTKCNEVISKIKESYKNKSKKEREHINLKRSKTNLKKYNVEYVMQVPEFSEKCNKYSWKNYMLPSGKIINIQGYENKALDLLFECNYKENEIITKRKYVPEIWYIQNGRKHRYFTDIYIPSENLIIEVKSIWTMDKYLEKNLLKAEACQEAGYNFQFMIF